MITLNHNPILNNEKIREGWRDELWVALRGGVSFFSVLSLIHELLYIGCGILILFVVFLSFRVNEVIIHWDCVTPCCYCSICSRFYCDCGFDVPKSGGCSSIELVLRSVIFVICGLLRMRIVFSSCSF